MNAIKKGTIIKGPQWAEPVIVDLLEDFGEYKHIVGSTRNSHIHIELELESRITLSADIQAPRESRARVGQ